MFDGSAERVLRRFRARFDGLECVRVDVAPGLRDRRYLGTLWRLLAADDPAVDVFLCRDLDDALDPRGLRLVADAWLDATDALAHVQAEPYATPRRPGMLNLGWYGQRRWPGQPSMRAALERFVARPGRDFYTADEEFLTLEWVARTVRPAGRVVRLPSHAHRRAATTGRAPAAYRAFQRARLPTVDLAARDPVVRFGY